MKHGLHAGFRFGFLLVALLLALLVVSISAGLPAGMGAVAAVTAFAGVLWFTEAVPLWITALAVPALLVMFAGIRPVEAFAPFFDPVIALLLGGFVLGLALSKQGIDVRVADLIARVCGRRAKLYLLGLMAATAFISLWIANSAAAAVMMPVGVAAITATGLRAGSKYAKAVVLGVAYSATIGGIGTLVGTPPNLIAARWLGESGLMNVTFADWMARALPIVLVMIPLAWLVLTTLNKPEVARVKVRNAGQKPLTSGQKFTIGIFALTVLLWVTEPVHGVHNSVVAILPVVAFFGLDILKKDDVGRLGWEILILVGGGLALGSAMHSTGLDAVLASGIAGALAGQAELALFLLLALFTIGLTVFVANTAAAAILIPLMIPATRVLGIDPVAVTFLIGIAVSFDFLIPVGTPPNAIAYATGFVHVKDTLKAGIIIAVLGAVILSVFATLW